MAGTARKRVKRWFGALVALLVLCLIVFAAMHRQEIQDRFRAIGFEPSESIVRVLDSLHLTDAGKRIFLATRPTIDGSQRFNEQCSDVDHSDQGHVLGCYTDNRIHLFEVSDARVKGIVGVTAGHELLHAAFARLGEGDRTRLSEQLREAYDTLAENDPALAERMSLYENLSDSAYTNELHSILGTEVRDLPDWLEQHYAQWFADRDSLLDAFDAYHAVFVGLQNEAQSLERTMRELRLDVERRKTDYDAAVERFNADAAEFSKRNDRFEFSDDPREFERIRGELADRRSELQATMAGLEADIERYNDLRAQLSALSETSSELDQQLNSELAPVTTRPS
ncbi:hypothetical protein D3248_08800 [Leucobacter zeae]|nr:hypothetical protein [Leucobacter zeae]